MNGLYQHKFSGCVIVMNVLELAGWFNVAAVLGYAAFTSHGAIQRSRLAAKGATVRSKLFEQQARILLDTEKADRARNELTWSGLRKFYIDRKVLEAEDLCSFYLKAHDRKPLPPFLPGQYLTFQLKVSDHLKPIIRCYSLSDSPTETDHYRVTIKRIGAPPKNPDAPPGVSSNYFHKELAEGDILDVRAPGGAFYLNEKSNRPVVLIGGGIGLTPVLSMLEQIYRTGSKRETWFFYGVRNRSEHIMYDRLAEISSTLENVNVVVCYSSPNEADKIGLDYQHKGFVSAELFKKLLPSNNYEFYICGPPPMMEMITQDLSDWGVPEEDINFEAFGPATIKSTNPLVSEEGAETVPSEADEVDVVFEHSKKTLRWSTNSGSILELAENNGIALDFGCRAGNCGTCTTAILEGKVTYLNTPGAPPKEGTCLACIAVPDGRLVIDG